MLAARYSSRSSGSVYSVSCLALSSSYFSWKASEMYFKKIRPSTTCLYSAASIWPRNLSAICQSLSSKPRLAPFCFPIVILPPYTEKVHQYAPSVPTRSLKSPAFMIRRWAMPNFTPVATEIVPQLHHNEVVPSLGELRAPGQFHKQLQRRLLQRAIEKHLDGIENANSATASPRFM